MVSLTQRSPKERMWIIGGALAAVLIVVIGWLLLISPQRSETDRVNADTGSVRASNVALQSRIASLRDESKNMGAVRRSLVAAQQALPSTSGVPDFLRSLQKLGASTGAQVVSLSVGAPTDVSAVGGSATSSAPKGVYGLAIAAQVNGAPGQLDTFLDKLQTVQPRAVLITHITQGSQTGGSSLQLAMQAFVAPSSAAEQSQLSRQAVAPK